MDRFRILKLPDSYKPCHAPQTPNSEWNDLAERTTMDQWMAMRNPTSTGTAMQFAARNLARQVDRDVYDMSQRDIGGLESLTNAIDRQMGWRLLWTQQVTS